MKIKSILIIGKNASGDIEEETLELVTYNWFERLINWFERRVCGSSVGHISSISIQPGERKLWPNNEGKGQVYNGIIVDDIEINKVEM